MIVGVGAVALALLVLFWKEFKLLAFDPEFAAGLGLPVVWLDVLLTGLFVLSIAIGLESVGVVLMSSLVVAPAAAARQWTDRLGRDDDTRRRVRRCRRGWRLAVSHFLSGGGRTVPTGPTIVLCATGIAALSFLWRFARNRAWLSRREMIPPAPVQ